MVIRKNADDLSDWVSRAAKFYKGLNASIAYRPAVIKFPSGAIIRTGHLKDDQAYTKYQGHEYQRILIEELTQIPDEKRYLQLLASCRSTDKTIKPQVFCTTNPGGIGHQWVKQRFVDVAPPNTVYTDTTSGRSRIYIPALIDDNPTLMEADPNYVNFLESLKNTDSELWKAWRLGDWQTFAGQFFKEFRVDLHVTTPFIPNKQGIIIGGLDWGYNAPFAFHLAEISKVKLISGVSFYRVKTFAELYLTGHYPQQAAQEVLKLIKVYGLTIDEVAWVRADPAIFNKGTDGSTSIRDQFIKSDNSFHKLRPGSNDRIAGWAIMHNWLSLAPDGLPYWQITQNCINLIKEIGSAVYDENKIEDLVGEYDHALDEQRYMLKALKWIDASVGASYHPKPQAVYAPQAPRFINQKQLSMDIDAFGDPGATDGDIGGVIRS